MVFVRFHANELYFRLKSKPGFTFTGVFCREKQVTTANLKPPRRRGKSTCTLAQTRKSHLLPSIKKKKKKNACCKYLLGKNSSTISFSGNKQKNFPPTLLANPAVSKYMFSNTQVASAIDTSSLSASMMNT